MPRIILFTADDEDIPPWLRSAGRTGKGARLKRYVDVLCLDKAVSICMRSVKPPSHRRRGAELWRHPRAFECNEGAAAEDRCCGLCLLLTSIRLLINLIIRRQFNPSRGFISHDPPVVEQDPYEATMPSPRSWQRLRRACVSVCSLSDFLHNMPLVKCFHNYFTCSHTLPYSHTLFSPHHNSLSHLFLLLPSLFSSVRPSLFSVLSFIFSSWPCLCA